MGAGDNAPSLGLDKPSEFYQTQHFCKHWIIENKFLQSSKEEPGDIRLRGTGSIPDEPCGTIPIQII
jgi:hypothetical protein